MYTETHHTIPISMGGGNSLSNCIDISKQEHDILHKEQNIPYKMVRIWREKVNGIIIPNEFTEMERLLVHKKFFENIGNNSTEVVRLQLGSLYSQQSDKTIKRSYSDPRIKAYELLERITLDRINYIHNYYKKGQT